MFSAISEWLEPWYNRYAIMVLSSAFAFSAYEAVDWSCLSASDWGTWAGAVGTVATLAATIWLATAGERKRERDQRDLAIIAAATLETAIVGFLVRANTMMLLPPPGTLAAPDDPHEALEECIFAIRNVDLWSREDLVALVYLPGHVAARLASLGTQIRATLNELNAAAAKSLLSDLDIGTVKYLLQSELPSYAAELAEIKTELSAFLAAQRFLNIE